MGHGKQLKPEIPIWLHVAFRKPVKPWLGSGHMPECCSEKTGATDLGPWQDEEQVQNRAWKGGWKYSRENTHFTIVHLNQDENRAGYQLVVLSGDTAAEAQESRVGIFLLFLRGEGGNGVVSFSIRDS